MGSEAWALLVLAHSLLPVLNVYMKPRGGIPAPIMSISQQTSI